MVFTPVSTALMNIFIFLTLVFVLLSGNFKNSAKIAWKNPVTRSSKVMSECRQISKKFLFSGIDKAS